MSRVAGLFVGTDDGEVEVVILRIEIDLLGLGGGHSVANVKNALRKEREDESGKRRE